VITGHQEGTPAHNIFMNDSWDMTCTNTGVSLSGSDAGGTATELTAFLTYNQCFAHEAWPLTFDLNGCHYDFDQPTHVADSEHKTWKSTVDVVCPEIR
jgi:hypothetical protein